MVNRIERRRDWSAESAAGTVLVGTANYGGQAAVKRLAHGGERNINHESVHMI